MSISGLPKKPKPMDPVIKEKWVAALRSGEYRRGSGQLVYHRGCDGKDAYCCLGVLCKIAVDEGVIRKIPEVSGNGAQGNYLPRKVAQWAGISRSMGAFSVQCELAHMNDVGWTFETIAAEIEEYL